MTVVSKTPGRADIAVQRGCTNRFGVRWYEDRLDGSGAQPKDASSWNAEFTMCYPDGTEALVKECSCDSGGLVYAELAPSDTESLPGTRGGWRIEAESSGERRRLAEGDWRLV